MLLEKEYYLLPTGKSGRCFIDETTRLIDAWVRDSPYIALRAVMIMSSFYLQKPSKDSKTKDHTKDLKRRLQLWTDGYLAELLKQGETIPSSLKQVNGPKTVPQPSKKFNGNVDNAIKLKTNYMQNGILPLTDTTLKLLKQKHPKSPPTTKEILMPDQP